jgi:hypothetical protein
LGAISTTSAATYAFEQGHHQHHHRVHAGTTLLAAGLLTFFHLLQQHRNKLNHRQRQLQILVITTLMALLQNIRVTSC